MARLIRLYWKSLLLWLREEKLVYYISGLLLAALLLFPEFRYEGESYKLYILYLIAVSVVTMQAATFYSSRGCRYLCSFRCSKAAARVCCRPPWPSARCSL
ncbi:hypothetical protein [Paenibacillus turpanensis]|uniref:hypothetical protein n=1 Tax=Paenibacillus turpanensis TaxID=2689078 RepID=UPI00140CA865|nr:hypothetical protein [Paenibacillus turpanensis]